MTHKLLLADDSVTIQRVVELTFSGEDVQVVTVGDGEQAIARIPIELPDIVLADIGMPKRSGYEVAAFVKGRPDLAHIPVLLLAGAFEPVDEARAQQVHSDGVLVKPFEPQQVISRVKELIESARAATPKPSAVLPELPLPRHEGMATPQPSVVHREPEAWIPEPAARSLEPDARRLEPEARSLEPEAPRAEPAVRSAKPAGLEPQLDDYFSRLDAAFAQLGSELEHPVAPASMSHDEHDARELPTVESLLASPPSPVVQASRSSPATHGESTVYAPAGEAEWAPPVAESGGGRNLVADMFAALFAVEQGEAGAPPVQVSATRPAPAVTDDLVDEVTRRVIERLAPGAANALVRQVVSEVAERLIREEIARIKSAVGSRL